MTKVSIIVLNWNGKKFLKKCFDSLHKLTYKSVELILVDNNSSDGSVDFIQKNYPKVIVIKNKDNFGFAKGNNIGFAKATGEYVLILNNDTVVTPSFLEPLLEDLKKDPSIACIQPQIRLMENKNILDGVGAFLTPTGFLYHYGYLKNINDKKYNKQIEIFSAKGACILLSKAVIKKIGLFDEDFFIFFEETDLCYRIWLSGHSVIYEPRSIIYHLGGGDTTASNTYQYERRTYLSFRNMICSYLKNFGTNNLLTIFPLFNFFLFALLIYYIVQGKFNLVKVILQAYYWNILHMSDTFAKRRKVQYSLRKVSDFVLAKSIIKSPRIGYFYALLTAKLKNFQD